MYSDPRKRPCYPYCSDHGFTAHLEVPNVFGWLFSTTFLSLLFALIVVYTAVKSFNKWSIVLLVLTAIFFYLLLINMGDNVLANSLPSTTYPLPPHLGHNGVSDAVLGSD